MHVLWRLAILLAFTSLLAAPAARAMLDIRDRGPMLHTGRMVLRVTNAGILGNAFFEEGLSSDPSLEFPAYSGNECLHHCELWVGAIDEGGQRRVSGGPKLEWRPTLSEHDRVQSAWAGRPGTRRLVDDDRDGRMDEEELNGRDDDGDGEVDEDLGLFSQQALGADFVDDRPEAAYVFSTGESHRALGLAVRQEVYGWAMPGYDGIAGLQFRITNHGQQTLREVYVGLLADLDVRVRSDATGHVNDRIVHRGYSRSVFQGVSSITIGGSIPFVKNCVAQLEQTLPVVIDGVDRSLPAVTVVPLGHTIDPLAFIRPDLARAPARVAFRSSVFLNGAVPGQGGVPLVDANRYAALRGELPQASENLLGDWVVLVSCGPFARLAPRESIEFTAALVAAEHPDSLPEVMGNAAYVHHGFAVNLVPDTTGAGTTEWTVGRSGKNGHEVCLEPPSGVTFLWNPHCPDKFYNYGGIPPFGAEFPVEEYRAGICHWTDADCDECTGLNGAETALRWLNPGVVPPPPTFRAVPGPHQIRLEWDNLPEILIQAGRAGPPGARFVGYRVYKLADWRRRESLLPPREKWALYAAFGSDTSYGEQSLSAIVDTTLDYERILYERRLYPVGRYVLTDRETLDGFDYVYVVTTVVETAAPGGSRVERYESPLVASFDQVVSPHAEAVANASSVWVVPNPFRAGAQWDRPPVQGDRLTRHIDFMGLPRALSTIKVWTVAGDFVAQIEHDGSGGNGQASWDLVSRNGQDVESGIYLFSVESSLGQSVGRFVVIR